MIAAVPAILQVIQQGQFRGAEVFALDLSLELRREGSWDASLVSLFGVDEAYRAAVVESGLTLAVAQSDGDRRGFDARLAWRLRDLIDDGGYCIVQANGGGTLKYLVAARRLARRRWHLIYRSIGMGSFWRRGAAKSLAYRWLLAQPDLVVAVCRAVADDLRTAARVDPRRLTVVPNGVAASRIGSDPGARERVRSTLGVPATDPLLVYAGNLAPEKNLQTLIATVAVCRIQGLPVQAMLVGNGPARQALLEEVHRRRLESAVHFVGPQQKIGPYLAAADLCVLPSRSEGMPAVLIEAGLAGVPAAVFAVGGVPEVIEDGVTGVLVPPGDDPGFARAVCILLRDPARLAAMGRAAQDRYRRFEIAAIARAYRDMYARVTEGRRTR